MVAPRCVREVSNAGLRLRKGAAIPGPGYVREAVRDRVLKKSITFF